MLTGATITIPDTGVVYTWDDTLKQWTPDSPAPVGEPTVLYEQEIVTPAIRPVAPGGAGS